MSDLRVGDRVKINNMLSSFHKQEGTLGFVDAERAGTLNHQVKLEGHNTWFRRDELELVGGLLPEVDTELDTDSNEYWQDDPVHAQIEETPDRVSVNERPGGRRGDPNEYGSVCTVDGDTSRCEGPDGNGCPCPDDCDDYVSMKTMVYEGIVPPEEGEDTTNPKDALGIKKAALRLVPNALELEAVPAMMVGAHKYGPMNWRDKHVKMSVYIEAAQRHLKALEDGENIAEDPVADDLGIQVTHLSAAISCLGIIADAKAHGALIDDRVAGPAPQMLAALDRSRG